MKADTDDFNHLECINKTTETRLDYKPKEALAYKKDRK